MGQIPNFGAPPPPDSSLTVSGKAADAKVVGNKFTSLNSTCTALASSLRTTNTNLSTLKSNLTANGLQFRFGTDGQGTYGYYDSTGTLVPFSASEGSIEILKIFPLYSGGYVNAQLATYQFTKKYKYVLVTITMHDTDNNGDNYCKIFSSQQSTTAFATIKDYDSDWTPMSVSNFVSSDAPLADVQKNYTNDLDKNKTIYYNSQQSATCFQVMYFKPDVQLNETMYAYIQTYRRALVTVIGINW